MRSSLMSSHKSCSLAENKSFPGQGTQRNDGIRQLHFLELLIPREEYLEFLISSTCLGVNAKMHGLSWSFSLFCGTEEGRKECPSKWEQQLWARGDCHALLISKSFLPHPRIAVFTCFGNSPLIRALLVYSHSSVQPAQALDLIFLFLKLFFLPSNNSRAISSPHQCCHSVTTSSRSPRGDLSLTQKPKTNQTEQAGSGKERKQPKQRKRLAQIIKKQHKKQLEETKHDFKPPDLEGGTAERLERAQHELGPFAHW